MSIPLVKGMRDFYPDEMAVRNWITDAWRRVSRRNGFVEFDGPAVEYLDLYKAKSGEGIVSELFNFVDRGGRELALRAETTPSLARMVNERINSLPRPIKWFSISQCFRAEKPQKGRSREFLQWNVDYIGSDEILADAECIFTAVDLLAELGLGPEDVVVRIGSRPLSVAALRLAGVEDSAMEAGLTALDKRPKLSAEAFAEVATAAGIDSKGIDLLCEFQDAADLAAVSAVLDGQEVTDEIAKLEALMAALTSMGVGDYCRVDMRMVRGLAYYTGAVYEIFDTSGSLRAVGGGGRYDNLLEVLGGPQVGATGFGMGDVVLGILLNEKGKLPDLSAQLDCFLVGAGVETNELLSTVGRLRRGGVSCDYSTKRNVGKALKEANRRGARFAVILGDDGAGVKDLDSGEQTDVPIDDLLANPEKFFGV